MRSTRRRPGSGNTAAYSRLGKFDPAIADFSTGIELAPNQAPAWRNRGYVLAQVGRCKEAAADFAKAAEFKEAGIEPWYFHGLTCLQGGDQAAYRKICAVLFERFGTADEPLTAQNLAWTCVLAHQAAADQTRPVQLAERAVAKDVNEPAYRTTRGAAGEKRTPKVKANRLRSAL